MKTIKIENNKINGEEYTYFSYLGYMLKYEHRGQVKEILLDSPYAIYINGNLRWSK